MDAAQEIQLVKDVGSIQGTLNALSERVDRIDRRVGDLEHVPRGGSNGRRLRDRALPLGRDVTLGALLIEVAYRIVTGG